VCCFALLFLPFVATVFVKLALVLANLPSLTLGGVLVLALVPAIFAEVALVVPQLGSVACHSRSVARPFVLPKLAPILAHFGFVLVNLGSLVPRLCFVLALFLAIVAQLGFVAADFALFLSLFLLSFLRNGTWRLGVARAGEAGQSHTSKKERLHSGHGQGSFRARKKGRHCLTFRRRCLFA
jgi:hypothetical protein